MAEAKTKPTKQSVEKFIKSVSDAQARKDCATIAKLMQEATKAEPQMWGSSIVGFGLRQIQYAGGRTGDWPIIGFSPRKQNLTLYVGDYLKKGETNYTSRISGLRMPGCR